MRKIMATLFIAAVSVSLFASLSHAQDVYTDNVVIVFDDSGSMGEAMRDAKGRRMSVTKIAAAKVALYEVLKQVPDTTHVGLVTFNKKWIYPLGKKDDAKLKRAIDSLRDGGGTPLGQYMKAGADALLAKREKQHNYGSYRLLVVTDGEAGDSHLVNRYTPDIIARGITLDVIGVAMKKRHTLAEMSHSYRAANDPASLKKAIQEVFSEVSVQDKSVFENDQGDISALSPELAMVIIDALSKTGNHAIGTKPRPKVAKQTPPPAAQQTTQPSQQPPTVSQKRSFPCLIVGVIVAVIAVVAIAVISKLSS